MHYQNYQKYRTNHDLGHFNNIMKMPLHSCNSLKSTFLTVLKFFEDKFMNLKNVQNCSEFFRIWINYG